MALDWFNLLKRIGLASTKYRFYRTWVTVRPVGSTKSCRSRDNSDYIRIWLTVQERTVERMQGSNAFGNARAGCRPACQEMRKCKGWDMAALDWVHDIRRSEPYWGYPSVIVRCRK
ncbi:hypothetical protein PIB30_028154 [Stylosanthes scabra]|uniref:Uncharacterized protein n=1 Tax=Stylosanthes scabra TaxID=79078 RepID=A0ABU6X8H1_9FABA|nr:hypothetical protein [Stylosanthes scabra]